MERPDADCESGSLSELLLDMAKQRSVDTLLGLIVNRLTQRSNVALARIWLVGPGDVCESCVMRTECPDQRQCLHLVASAGRSLADPKADWSQTSGHFRRIPFGVRKVGRVASSGDAALVIDLESDTQWVADHDWVRREQLYAFGGQPLCYQGQVLGVLAVFARTNLTEDCLDWLRLIADHAAIAIANARAFEEIERLRRRLELENEYLRDEVMQSSDMGDIVGQSAAITNLIRQIDLVAPTDAGVLILGESGTGKELVAREIHRRSARSERPMIRVNCASVSHTLYESEFFGHVKGSFTGAIADRPGRFELADGGTLFLDEVGEIPLELQSKLLRVLQEGQFERIGDTKTKSVDVRVLAATNRDLKREVEAGRFRQDLYYRLNVFPIEVAPLRRRREDIPMLAAHFLDRAHKRFNLPVARLTQANVVELQRYDWPGNIRELQNVIERALITATGGRLHFQLASNASSQLAEASPNGGIADVHSDAEMTRRVRVNMEAALRRADGRISGPGGAAELLGVPATTLASRIKRMGLQAGPTPTGS